MEIDHEIFSTVILSLPLIEEGQLSVSGEKLRTNTLNRFIRIEYHINPKNSFDHIQKKKKKKKIVMSRDMNCLPLDWLLMVNKDL